MVTEISNTWEADTLVNDTLSGNTFTPTDYDEISEAADSRTFPYIVSSVVTNYNNSGTTYSTITTDNSELDAFGNFSLVHSYTNDQIPIHKYTRTVYNNNISYWILGQPLNIRTGTTDPGPPGSPAARETKFSYYTSSPVKPWLLKEKIAVHWVSGVEHNYATTYSYDSYGNLTSEQDPKGNPTTITYDSNGMFPIVTTNALGQTTTRTFEPDFGTVLTEIDDANNLTTTINTYDEFGRIKTVNHPPDGSSKTYTYNIAAGNHYMVLQASAQPAMTTYYDNFGRVKMVKTAATDGTTIYQETQYDNAGRVSKESLPYYSSGYKYWSTYTYDPIRGYLQKQTNPDGTYKTFTVDGLTETATDENSHTKTTLKDTLGRIVKITEATGGITYYNYDIFDNLTYVKDPLGSETSIVYDDLGRKTGMADPYMGNWSYAYDANGNLTSQTDGKGHEITMPNYDGLNRITQKNYLTDGKQVVYTYGEVT